MGSSEKVLAHLKELRDQTVHARHLRPAAALASMRDFIRHKVLELGLDYDLQKSKHVETLDAPRAADKQLEQLQRMVGAVKLPSGSQPDGKCSKAPRIFQRPRSSILIGFLSAVLAGRSDGSATTRF